MSCSSSIVTLSSLIKKDLEQAYCLPAWPSSYSPQYRFYNDKNYRVFDYPPSSETFRQYLYPFRNLAAAGEEVPILTDHQPPLFMKNHWKKWLSAFPLADLKTVDEGLRDDVSIVTNAAMQCIPRSKHSVDPDVLYKVQLKSSIPEIGVPCPEYMTEDNLSFPCMVKIDMSWSGMGNRVANNADELSAILKEIRVDRAWKEGVIFQKIIDGIDELLSFEFYLYKSSNIYWIGTISGGVDGFSWTNGVVDWDKQEYYKDLFYEKFVVPVKNYLHEQGYFGIVMCEILMCKHGMYLVDLNPRLSGDTTHLLLAPYMAQFGFKHSILKQRRMINKSAQKLVELANDVNTTTSLGKVVIITAADVDEERSEFEISVFGTSTHEVVKLHDKFSDAPEKRPLQI